MNHFDEEVILKYSLEILDTDESQKIRQHLKECEICSSLLNDIEKQNKLIEAYNPKIDNVFVPLIRNKNKHSIWMKRAAVLLLGFLLGCAVSFYFQPEKAVVVEQFFISQSPRVNPTLFTVCPSIDIYRGRIDL